MLDVTPHRTGLAQANDNQRRLPARPLQCPPKLACRWVVNDGGRPECHWKFESDGSTKHRCATESQWPGWEFWYGSRSNDALAAVMALQHGSKKQEDAG